jgi:hypothetical protein
MGRIIILGVYMLDQIQTFLTIVGGIIAVLNFIGIIIVFMANRLAFNKIMTNDFVHVNKNISDIVTEQKCIKEKVISLSEDVAYVKGSLRLSKTRSKKIAAKV